MAVSHFVKVNAAVDHVAVVRQIGEVIYSNQSTAVAAVCGVITEGFGSSLTADVIGRSLPRLPLYDALPSERIDVSQLTPAETARQIFQLIESGKGRIL